MNTKSLVKGTLLYALLAVLVWGVCFSAVLGVDYMVYYMVSSGGWMRELTLSMWWIWALKVSLAVVGAVTLWASVGRIFKLEEIHQATEVIVRKFSKNKGPARG